MSYKFILDNSVLDDSCVKKIRESGLIKACNTGRFAFYVTPVLLRELLNFASQGTIPAKAMGSVKFILELKWQRLFNEPGGLEGIFTMELEGKAQSEYLFIDHLAIKENLEAIFKGGEFIEEAKKEIKDENERWTGRKTQNKNSYSVMREDVNKKLRQDKSMTRKESKFETFLEYNSEATAVEKIKKSINSKVPKDNLIEYWKKHKDKCSYFNKFIEGWLFTAWYPMSSELTPKIDINAYEDIEYLIYLVGLDGIVSNEKGFMKAACENLFPHKDFLSVDEFAERLKYA